MPEQGAIPTLTTSADFDRNLDGYLLNNNKLALFLDYDGTLAPIASHPNLTEMVPETEAALKRLAVNPHVFLAVISGRGVNDVKGKVDLKNITYGGNHGIEIENPDGSRSDFKLPEEVKENYRKLVKELNEKFNFKGIWVEDKKVSLTYHYTEAKEPITEDIKNNVIKTIESYGFRANQAKDAIEAKPPINWNKGEATLFLLRKNFGDNWQEFIKPIFAGDDTTDEDGMKALKGVGKSFRVSTDPNVKTYADYRLPSTNEITLLLKWIEKHYH